MLSPNSTGQQAGEALLPRVLHLIGCGPLTLRRVLRFTHFLIRMLIPSSSTHR